MIQTISGKNIDLTDGLKDAVEKAFAKVAAAVPDDTPLAVVLSAKKGVSRVEASMTLSGHIVRIEETGKDMYALIKKSANMMLSNLRKYRERLVEKWHAPLSIRYQEGAADEPVEITVRKKYVELDVMSAEDACVQMELSDHDFYVFINEENDRTNVVYRKKDGGYGLIIC